MHLTFASNQRRIACAVLVAATLAATAASPAGASASPPRDITQYACPPGTSSPFTDIADSVHADAVRCAAAYGFINGTTDTTFSPDAPVTRGQLASFLARFAAFAGRPLDTSDQGFTDIAGSVHRDAINALAALGAIQGTTPTTFSPDLHVSRAQLASMVGRLLAVDLHAPDAFSDDDGSVHEAYINGLAGVGIVGGVTSDQYNPSGDLSRGAAASILARAQDYSVAGLMSPPVGGFRVLRASLSGAKEVPGPGDADARAMVDLIGTSIPGLLCIRFDETSGFAAQVTAVHVDHGDTGATGPVVLTLPMPPKSQCVAGQDQNAIDAIYADPSGFYVNMDTAAFPNGAIRGQLDTIAASFTSSMDGTQEVPGPGATNAIGVEVLDALSEGTTLCALGLYLGPGTPTAAHIHDGAAGAAGPVVVTLPPFETNFPISHGCVDDIAASALTDVVAHPRDHYANIHTDGFPDGAVRGQLEAVVPLSAPMSGHNEVPGPGDGNATGDADVELFQGDEVCVSLHVRGTDRPTAAHIHAGAAGASGPIVVTLPTPVFNTAIDCVQTDPATYDAIAANPAAYYVNVHTEAFPDGALRGQLAHAPSAVTQYRLGGPSPQARSAAALRWNS